MVCVEITLLLVNEKLNFAQKNPDRHECMLQKTFLLFFCWNYVHTLCNSKTWTMFDGLQHQKTYRWHHISSCTARRSNSICLSCSSGWMCLLVWCTWCEWPHVLFVVACVFLYSFFLFVLFVASLFVSTTLLILAKAHGIHLYFGIHILYSIIIYHTTYIYLCDVVTWIAAKVWTHPYHGQASISTTKNEIIILKESPGRPSRKFTFVTATAAAAASQEHTNARKKERKYAKNECFATKEHTQDTQPHK